MDNIRLGQFTQEQERFMDMYFTDQEVDRTKVFNLVSTLAKVPYLRDVRMTLEGGLISWGGLKVVADVEDAELSRAMAEVAGLGNGQKEQHYQARAVSAYERLEQALGQPGLFQHVGVREVPVGHPLENRTEVDHYELQGTVSVGRKEGTRYKVDLTVPVELRVQ